MINSIKDLREENKNMLFSINETIKLMLAITTNMSHIIKDIGVKLESKDNLDEYDSLEQNGEKESKALKLIKASNHGRRKAKQALKRKKKSHSTRGAT
ncbi:hypothetical protein Tco_0404798 [Tanacetum coccineum]